MRLRLRTVLGFALGALLLFYLYTHPDVIPGFNPGHVPYFK